MVGVALASDWCQKISVNSFTEFHCFTASYFCFLLTFFASKFLFPSSLLLKFWIGWFLIGNSTVCGRLFPFGQNFPYNSRKWSKWYGNNLGKVEFNSEMRIPDTKKRNGNREFCFCNISQEISELFAYLLKFLEKFREKDETWLDQHVKMSCYDRFTCTYKGLSSQIFCLGWVTSYWRFPATGENKKERKNREVHLENIVG